MTWMCLGIGLQPDQSMPHRRDKGTERLRNLPVVTQQACGERSWLQGVWLPLTVNMREGTRVLPPVFFVGPEPAGAQALGQLVWVALRGAEGSRPRGTGLLCAHVSSITWQMCFGWGWHTARPVKLPPPLPG